MKAPVYLYYQLENFYQNHRRYVKSRSFDQLRGEDISEDDVKSECDPIVYNKDVGVKQSMKLPGGSRVELDQDAVAVPCGLVAKSVFNDTFAIIPPTDPTKFKIEQTGIAWESDVKYKFKNSDNLEKQW